MSLRLEIKVPGNKIYPKVGDSLKMHYTGWWIQTSGIGSTRQLTINDSLENGTKFDSSRDRNVPFEFIIGINKVISGWDDGILKMSLGERSMLYIPSDKGYGSTGAGEVIPPNVDLIVDVELLEINGVMAL